MNAVVPFRCDVCESTKFDPLQFAIPSKDTPTESTHNPQSYKMQEDMRLRSVQIGHEKITSLSRSNADCNKCHQSNDKMTIFNFYYCI